MEFLLRKQYSSFAASRDVLTCPPEVALDDILTELVPQDGVIHTPLYVLKVLNDLVIAAVVTIL